MKDTERLAREFGEHIAGLRFPDAFGMLADDGLYTVIGTTPASGLYHGPRDLLERLVPLLADFVEPPVVTFEDPIVQGDRAVLLGSGRGVGPTGPYDQPHYAFVMKVSDGRIVEIVEFMDTMMLQSAVFGERAA
ncbi:nuclear transport factor 2 family protein [Novosphingobium sp. BL-52-GroH]|uniref:nuclear transport factor 2 family protein n=1 Tax=Novosphingobium sp. BL-52-GroH TaxID=3349877 RepID=UPI0038500CBD